MLYVRHHQLSVIFVVFALFIPSFLFKVSHKTEKCLVYTPAYPSAGGSGCSSQCIENGGQKTSSYGAAFYRDNHHWPLELIENMEFAASILKRYGPTLQLNTREGREHDNLHLSFDYYCCYTEHEAVKIGQFLESYSWTPHEVKFDKMGCVIVGYDDFVALVLLVDKESQDDLTRWALKNERDLEITTGVHKHIPHTRLEHFHMTLGLLNQSNFPVQSAMEEINRVIPPGTWHKTPVVLYRPVCKGCLKDQLPGEQLFMK